ncbi:hypothetical protein [Desulfuromonas thiophila]|uniref:hypothetical protein n=1 Tax=Desulfuromonas thiophila TaxID=57664 RepID=UPI001495EA2B|nr:hypothetical protein [Desulfuromonas thiophila]
MGDIKKTSQADQKMARLRAGKAAFSATATSMISKAYTDGSFPYKKIKDINAISV